MSTTYQSMIVLCIASFFVVIVWYIDKEIKGLFTNIKIIQNMLKTVITNQNITPTHSYIPFFDKKNDNGSESLEVQTSENTEGVVSSEEILEEVPTEEILKEVPSEEILEEVPTEEMEEKILRKTIETENTEVLLNEQENQPKKKRSYRKKIHSEITV